MPGYRSLQATCDPFSRSQLWGEARRLKAEHNASPFRSIATKPLLAAATLSLASKP